MKKIICFISLNYPNNVFFNYFINNIIKYGIDFIEIGIPYIDSIADGNIVSNSYKFLIKNYNIKNFFNSVYNFKLINNINIVIIMSYYNPIIQFNEYNFVYLLNLLKIDSILIIDYNLECNNFLYKISKKKKINFINFISCNISNKKNFFLNKFFLYFNYFSYIKGITGDKKFKKVKYLNNYLKKLNYFIFGFGLSNLKDIIFMKKIKNFVFGSFIIYLINKYYFNYKKIFKMIKIISFINKNI
ncbi:tryptophan synthase subunit alpha [Candidatus Carsonella ruddii]|uniref:tryptophan synthase subunit alpha n=1 Tax=Carsonella ruddii TaxID=114186 RepID=UPI003D818314